MILAISCKVLEDFKNIKKLANTIAIRKGKASKKKDIEKNKIKQQNRDLHI